MSAAAERDIDGIWDYGAAHFGAQAAQRYAETLTAMMQRLVEFPNLGEAVAGRVTPLRSIHCGSHMIFYRPASAGIYVTRILHRLTDGRQQV